MSCSSHLKSECVCCARSTERPTGDLRERMKNKRQDVDSENVKRDLDEPTSPTVRVSLQMFTPGRRVKRKYIVGPTCHTETKSLNNIDKK